MQMHKNEDMYEINHELIHWTIHKLSTFYIGQQTLTVLQMAWKVQRWWRRKTMELTNGPGANTGWEVEEEGASGGRK